VPRKTDPQCPDRVVPEVTDEAASWFMEETFDYTRSTRRRSAASPTASAFRRSDSRAS
jgi:hypothetical protein